MIDRDLARLDEVEVKALNQAVKRNISRFPDDFMFRLSAAEADSLRSQNVTLDVTTSDRAVMVNIEIMRTFVKLRGLLASNAELADKLDSLESKYDRQFKVVFDAIRQLMAPPPASKRRIGFAPWEEEKQ